MLGNDQYCQVYNLQSLWNQILRTINCQINNLPIVTMTMKYKYDQLLNLQSLYYLEKRIKDGRTNEHTNRRTLWV